MGVSLIVPAAGRGTRFGGSVPKQLLPLRGVPILVRSLRAFVGLVDETIVATAPDLAAELGALIAAHGLAARIVHGGETRQASVHAALRACAHDRVLVHDAVRPLVPRACIAACIAALDAHPAALVALRCVDTVKRAGVDGAVAATVPRDALWLAQTPQGFRRELGLAAFARAEAEHWTCSDDAEVLERAGQRVALVPGDARNRKVTTPDDLALAEALLAAEAATAGG